jgi:hypothetical protein
VVVWRSTEVYTEYWHGTLNNKNLFKDLGSEGMIILTTDAKKIGWESVYWIHPDEDKDKWRVFLTTVINIWVHKMHGI